MTLVIAMAIIAVVAFPVLDMAGIEVKSVYVVAAATVIGLLAILVSWRYIRGLWGRRDH